MLLHRTTLQRIPLKENSLFFFFVLPYFHIFYKNRGVFYKTDKGMHSNKENGNYSISEVGGFILQLDFQAESDDRLFVFVMYGYHLCMCHVRLIWA